MKTLFSFILLLSSLTYAQFDSLIFTKEMRLDYNKPTNVYPLGDQNKDGFDDIMLYDCNEKRGFIYFGGSPMDTIPDNSIQFFDSVYVGGQIGIIDINDDGINDIVLTMVKLLRDIGFYTLGPLRVYYGGAAIDTIPNLTYSPPKGTSGFSVIKILNDFNGDGRKEFVIYDGNLPFSEQPYGTLYFYNTESEFDTIPHYVLTGDSIKKISIYLESSGDINGDGKTDFTIYGGEGNLHRHFMSFYLGNENFDLEPSVTYYKDEHIFDPEYMRIINDINGDGKDDILINDYGKYPWYYFNAILYGSFPIDTIPDVGLNTQNEGLNIYETYSLGDVNGDGYNDFFSHTLNFGYRNIKLWLGGKNMPGTVDDIANETWFGQSNGFGRILSNAGDMDGDGANDIVIGQILYGAQPDDNCNTGWIYIIRGRSDVVSVEEEKANLPELYKIEEPFPNPFNPSTTISYTLPYQSTVELTIYDIMGREVKTFGNLTQSAGMQSIVWNGTNSNGDNVSSGIYIYKIRLTSLENNEVFEKSAKLMLLK